MKLLTYPGAPNPRRVHVFLAEKGIEMVYGGGNVGLMGMAAKGALDHGGKVTGVITEKLMEMEVGHTGLTEMKVTGSMHERKSLMNRLSGGFIVLPGSFNHPQTPDTVRLQLFDNH